MKKILITGGAGFLGSHLCDELTQNGNDIICVDNFYTGDKENISHLLTNPNFELIFIILPLESVEEIKNEIDTLEKANR